MNEATACFLGFVRRNTSIGRLDSGRFSEEFQQRLTALVGLVLWVEIRIVRTIV